MKRKTVSARQFLEGLHKTVVDQFGITLPGKSEKFMQTEVHPLILKFLEGYFRSQYKDPEAKARRSFYWEGQAAKFDVTKTPLFGSRSYPDFVIREPYRVAVEFKQSKDGSTVKEGIGQSIIHTVSGDFDFAYCLFSDLSGDGRIRRSIENAREAALLDRVWREFNVIVRFTSGGKRKRSKAR